MVGIEGQGCLLKVVNQAGVDPGDLSARLGRHVSGVCDVG